MSAPMIRVSRRKSTLVTPVLSVAVAVITVVFDTVLLFVGEVRVTVGLVVSGVGGGVLFTVTVIGSDVVVFPAWSVALVVSV